MNVIKTFAFIATSHAKKIALLSMLFTCTIIYAENIGKIEGQLICSSTTKPIVYGTIALHSLPDSTLVTGIITDTIGHFEFNNLPFGSYILKCRSVGYKNNTTDNLVLSSTKPSVSLTNVIMEKDVINIDEVKVVSDRLKGTAKVDKTVYPISEKVASVSNTGLDILRMVPAVQVDFSKNVSLEGSRNILIYVDDKVRNESFLTQLDPRSIDKVEVMTNPSVKYGADVTGVINIKLKKDRKGGFSGSIRGEHTLNLDVYYSDLSINMEYGTGKYRMYASGSGVYNDFKFMSSTRRRTLDDSSEYFQSSKGDASFGWAGIYYGIDWFVNEKNTFNFYGYNSPRIGTTHDTNETKEWQTNGLTDKYLTNSPIEQNTSDKAGYYGMFYKRTFDKPAQEFVLDIQYFTNNNIDKKDFNEQYFLTDKITPTGAKQHRNEKADNFHKAINIKADYTHPVSENIKLDIGYQNNTSWNSNTFTKSNANATQFKYDEIRHAAYANISGQIKDFNWQGGLRFESSNIEINQETNPDYTCWLPQASLQQKINDKQSIKLSYRRSIQRPGIGQLNPFTFNIDSLNISKGNPNLKPSYHNKFELSYPIQHGSNFFSSGIYVNTFTDGFEAVKVISGNRSETYIDNVGKGIEYGIKLSGSFNFSKWLMMYPSLNVFKKELKEIELYEITGAEKFSFRTTIYNVFNLPKGHSIISYFYYESPTIASQVTIKRDINWILGFQKQILKNTGTISFITFNPFKKTYLVSETQTIGRNFTEVNKMTFVTDKYLAIKFSYNFQQHVDKIKKLHRKQNEPIKRGKGLL